MKKNTNHARKALLALFAMLLPLLANAEKVAVDGIWYNLTDETREAEVTFKGDSYISYYDEYSGSITLPATVTYEGVDYIVTSIGDDAFRDCSSITEITLPEGVTSIGDYAFSGCSSLTDITIPEGVTSIGSRAFSGCSSLTDITIPEGVTSIGDCAFSGCSGLERVTINCANVDDWFRGISSIKEIVLGEGVTSIESYAFSDCSSLPTITIPEGVTSIGDCAFSGCSSLTSITLPESVTSIGGSAFYYCSSLTTITIPEGVTSIGGWAFYNCSGLKTVTNYSDLPIERGSSDYGFVAYYADKVINIDEVIDGYAFKTKEGVHYLTDYIGDKTELTLPADYKGENYQIGERAFYGCSSLTAITIPEGVTSIGNEAFSGCSSLTAITIPEGVTSIGSRAFYNCSSLTAITIPEGVTSIGSSAFYDCSSLKELTLGKGIRKIESRAFYGCTALEKVTTYATRPPTAADINIFSDATYENATLYVPQGCIDKYQVMTGWSGFYTIEEMEGGTPNYLTLRQADNGEVGIVVDLGRTYKLRITAFEGWEIHSVTFNGEEVTAQLTEEGTFTTPALQADAVLNIAYEKTEDNKMVANTRASRIKVQGHHGTLRITGTTEGAAISIYTTDGMLVAQESTEGSETELTLPTGQVYIVTVADKVVKIGL